jgi:hypothetical protein
MKSYIKSKVDVNIEKNAFKIVNLKVAKEWNHYNVEFKARVEDLLNMQSIIAILAMFN